MRRIRFVALGIVSFVVSIFGALLAPGTFLNRALSAALCTVFSFNSAVCTASLLQSSERVVAATPPAVERSISDISGYLQAQRDPSEFGDEPSAPSPGSNPQAPPFPQDPGPNFPVRREFDSPDSSSNPRATETQLLGFQDSGSGKAILRFLDAGDCINNYEITRTTDGYPYAESITRAIPIEGRCSENSVLFTAQVTPDLDEIILSSNNNAPPVKIQGLNSNSWKITYTDQSGTNRSETVQMPLQSNSNGNEQTLQAHKTTSCQEKLNSTDSLIAKINCAYMDRQKRNCEQGRRVSEGMKYIINATAGFLSGGPKFALEKLMELTGNQLPKYPKLPPVPQPARLPMTVTGGGLLAVQQIAEGLMSLTCSIAFGDRYNNDFVKFMKEVNPDFASWLANTQMYAERRLNEDCKRQIAEQPPQQRVRNCRIVGVEQYNNITMNRGECAIQGPVMTVEGPVDGKTQCGVCNTIIGNLPPHAGSCKAGMETDPRIAFLGLNKPILCPPNWDSGW